MTIDEQQQQQPVIGTPQQAHGNQALFAQTPRIFKSKATLDTKQPNIFFAMLEDQFKQQNVFDDNQKFTEAFQRLGVYQVHFNYLYEQENRVYTVLKSAVLDKYYLSVAERIVAVDKATIEPDEQPSDFARRLRTIAGGHLGDNALLEKWFGAIPSDLRDKLMADKAQEPPLNLDQLAAKADRIARMIKNEQRSYAAAVMLQKQSEQDETEVEEAVAAINQQAVSRESGRQTNYSQRGAPIKRSSGRFFNRDNAPYRGGVYNQQRRFNPRYRQPNDDNLCINHQLYGRETRNCKGPFCSQWPGDLNAAGGR